MSLWVLSPCRSEGWPLPLGPSPTSSPTANSWPCWCLPDLKALIMHNLSENSLLDTSRLIKSVLRCLKKKPFFLKIRLKSNLIRKKKGFCWQSNNQTEYVSACGSKKWWCIESGCVLGTILANTGVLIIPHCCYGKVPSASLHLWRTAAVYPVYSPLLCPLLFLDNLPFLLQILNLCCQTVLSLKDMYSLLPGSPLYECLLSLVVISFSPCFSHFM